MLRNVIFLPVLLGFCVTASATPELWGYIDAQGRPHYADRQLDSRYELFNAGSAPVRPLPRSAASAPAGLQAAFEVSTGYKAVRHLIREAATDHGLDYALLKAVIATESRFDPQAVSPRGAVGLMQLMPATAQRFGVKADAAQTLHQRLTDPRTNLQAGARYLALLLRQFGGQTDLALAAYNAGEGAVQRAGRQIPNYPETVQYVHKVTRLYQYLSPPRGLQPASRPVSKNLNNAASSAPAL
ncbi:MAG: lytic transglycosylase domain-containing protein [Hydrogenophaga sp.]|nr:lytic transglycosylase domain-containing protein [Hydrogenophaga sp.]